MRPELVLSISASLALVATAGTLALAILVAACLSVLRSLHD